ncbi:2Fe-2S iron-sulfur cluster binding domain-containing protein [Bradyrhizobium sp. URHD0069]|uniref:2Fe-2S iron-sulfur cluster-binding protein n=1 Tax=Bradyrhizobium sp. URHD0069 TaxID=1380355 RepID=UPI0004968E5E|nr:2Fe-2S iron-sulfur cluster binding domain-containing protein [Bradyrhizobium sp. URHD0069]
MITIDISDKNGVLASFPAASGQRLLQAGLAAGLGLPHECATGTCGNCKATVVSGEVRRLWPNAPGAKVCRNPAETLLCQSAADGPVALTLRAAFTPPCDPPCAVMRGTLSRTRVLTPEISSFTVTLDDPIAYKPGQFVLISGLDVNGPRAYSMTEHQPQKSELSFLIRKDPAGAFTGALFNDSSTSHEVSVFGPLGRATFSSDEDRPFIAIAGGSGIAGVLAILDHALAKDHFEKHPSHIFFGLRDAESGYLLDELSSAVVRSERRLRVTVAFSNVPCSAELAARYPSLDFAGGFVHDVVRASFDAGSSSGLAQMKSPLFFVAGPPIMVNATLRVLVAERRISPTEIRYDRFG